jgi:hypothetical protein
MRVALPYLDAFGAVHRVERLRASVGGIASGEYEGKNGGGLTTTISFLTASPFGDHRSVVDDRDESTFIK